MDMMAQFPPIYNSQMIHRQNSKHSDQDFQRSSTEPQWRPHASSALTPDKRAQSEPILFPPLAFVNDKPLSYKTSKFPNRRPHRKGAGNSLVSRLGNILNKNKNGPQTCRTKGEVEHLKSVKTSRTLGMPKHQMNETLEIKDCKSDDGATPDRNNKGSPFSVRRKIEEFRHWQEEHHAVNDSAIEQENKERARKEAVEIAAIIEQAKSRSKKGLNKGKLPLKNIQEGKLLVTKMVREDSAERDGAESPPAKVDLGELHRVSSAKTWRTWRDVNDSYAYSDVRRYIKENKLMPPEKESWIKKWVKDVEISTEMDD